MSNRSQPPSKRHRRKVSDSDKARILAEYENASSLESAVLMRRGGIYASLLASWRFNVITSAPNLEPVIVRTLPSYFFRAL
jgi:transposase-like protein